MTGVGSTPRDLQSWMRDVNKRLVAQERRRVNGATWDGISGKPTTFPPSPHTHTWSDITDPPDVATKSYVDDKTWDWGADITGKPSTFPPSAHQHAAGDITSGTLPITRGGTGVTVNPSLLVNLASTAADTVFESAPRPGVTGVLGNANLPERLREIGPDISGTDLNVLRYNGWARGSRMGNSPLGNGWWYIYNEAHDVSGWRYQRIVGYTEEGANTVWMRQYTNASAWEPWRMIAGVIGWWQLPLTGAWTTDQSGPNAPSISRHGQTVVFRGRLRDGAAGSLFVAAGGLPTWARPANEFRLPIANNSGVIDSSSWINVWPDGGMASGAWTGITSTCSWPAAY